MRISSLRVRASAKVARTALATVSLAVLAFGFIPASAQGGGSKPIARDKSAHLVQGKNKVVKLSGSASATGQKRFTYTISSFPQHGTLQEVDMAKGKIRYTPDAEYFGDDFFSYTVNDGVAESDPGTVSLTVYKRGEQPTGPQLTQAEVTQIVKTAASNIADNSATIAVIDRAGRILAVYQRPGGSADDIDRALALARAGAFFSNNKAPLSSRTIRVLGGVHFPAGVRDTGPSDLYGIELTNRGCDFNFDYNPGKEYPVYTNFKGTGPGKGIGTGKPDFIDNEGKVVDPGGFPIFKNKQVAGGVAVTVAPPGNLGTQGPGAQVTASEFAAFQAAVPGLLPILPLGQPGRVILGGLELPFSPLLDQFEGRLTVPTPNGAGPNTGSFNPNLFKFGPVSGGFAPDGYLTGPRAGRFLSASQVNSIIMTAVNEALRTRAAIRLPIGSFTGMVVAVGDVDGTILGVFRMTDSTIFSIDVAITKARNVVYFSSDGYVDLPGVPPGTAITNNTLYSAGQPFFPIGINDSDPGPFFDTFLRDAANPCTQGTQRPNPNQSGIVWFPGSLPLYSGNTLIGGLGVSGDGVTQDDVVTFAGGQGFEAPVGIRADQVFIRGVRLAYTKFNRNPSVP